MLLLQEGGGDRWLRLVKDHQEIEIDLLERGELFGGLMSDCIVVVFFRTNQLMDHLEDSGEHPEEWEW